MKKLSLIGAILLLLGCGGSNTSSTSKGTYKVEGTVVDDLIANAIVKLYDKDYHLLAKTRTDKKGKYSVNIDYKGVVLTKVYCDENSTFIENNSKCNINEDNALLSANIIKDKDNIYLNVSPLSTLVVKLTNNNLSEESLINTKKKIAYLFGVDPITQDPISNNTYKTIIEGLHHLSKEKHLSVIELTNKLVNDIASDNTLGDDLNISSFVTFLNQNGVKNPLVENNGKVDLKEIDTSVNLDDIYATKQIIASIRNQLNNENHIIKKELNSFDKAIKSINTSDLKNSVTLLYDIIFMIINDKNSETFNITNQSYKIDIEKNNSIYNYKINSKEAGSIVINGDIPTDLTSFDTKFKINGSLINNVHLKGDVEISYSTEGKKYKLNINALSIKQNNLDVNITNLESYAYFNDLDLNDLNQQTIEGNVTINKLNINGNINNLLVDGNFTFSNYHKYDNSTNLLVNNGKFKNANYVPYLIKFKGTYESNESLINGDITVNINNYKRGTGTYKLGIELKNKNIPDVVVNATIKKDVNSSSINCSYLKDNNKWITLEDNIDNQQNHSIKITSTDGFFVKFKLNKNKHLINSANVYYNNKIVGTLKEENSIIVIKYKDASFETLN